TRIRHRKARTRTRCVCVVCAARERDVPRAAKLPDSAAERSGRHTRRRVSARVLYRRRNGGVEIVFLRAAACGCFWKEGLSATDGCTKYVPSVSAAREYSGSRDSARPRWLGLVVA